MTGDTQGSGATAHGRRLVPVIHASFFFLPLIGAALALTIGSIVSGSALRREAKFSLAFQVVFFTGMAIGSTINTWASEREALAAVTSATFIGVLLLAVAGVIEVVGAVATSLSTGHGDYPRFVRGAIRRWAHR